MVTVLPGLTVALAPGDCLVTVPLAAVEVASETCLTFRPLPVSVLWAVAEVSPTTFGTVTCWGPVDTNSVTTVFAGTLLPSGGLDLITRPLPTVELAWSVTLGFRWALVIACSALAWGSPFTSGTP